MKGQNCGITRVTFPKFACRGSSGFTYFNKYDTFLYSVTFRPVQNKWPHLNLPKHTTVYSDLNMTQMKGNDFSDKCQSANINLYKAETTPST